MRDEFKEEVRRRTDIVELVSTRVALRKSGKSFTGLCPFHEDKRPSFSVNPDSGRYRCFSCGEKGDCFDWTMKMGGLTFPEALRELAKRAGVALDDESARVDLAARDERRTRLAIMSEALNFYRESLSRASGPKEYLTSRGIDEAAVSKWQLGYSPSGGDALANSFKRKGIKLTEAKELFLVDTDASGGFYDKFRDRLMFPIRDEKGDLVAFGGRILRDGTPKYINSSETPIYHKGRVLYGLWESRDRMSKTRTATLCEGYLDVIACHQAGVEDAVASLGTALTPDQIALLERFVDRLTIFYDGDAAGRKAAAKALELAAKSKLRLRVAWTTPGDDPDSLLRGRGKEAVQRLVSEALSPYEYRIRSTKERLDRDDPDYWPEMIAALASGGSEIEVEEQLVRITNDDPILRKSNAARDRLRQDIARARRGNQQASSGRANVPAPLDLSLDRTEIAIFGAIANSELRAHAWPVLDLRSLMPTAAGRSLAGALTAAFPESMPGGALRNWIGALDDDHAQLLSDVGLDLRTQKVTEAMIEDVVRHWGRQNRQRSIEDLRARASQNDSEAARQAIERIRREKGEDPQI